MPLDLKTPSVFNLFREAVAVADMASLPLPLMQAGMTQKPKIEGRHIIVLPGFGAGDYSTAPLRFFLNRQGYSAEGWGLGFNNGGKGLVQSTAELSDYWDIDREREQNGEADVPALVDAMREQTLKRYADIGHPITLIGWSLGGYVAREVARDLPDEVDQVITMGSPVFGGPKYTRVAPLFKSRGVDVDWIEEEVEKRFARPIQQPVTAIYSKQDGVVGWEAAIDDLSPDVIHVEVNCSHMGLGLNANVWEIVIDALEGRIGE